MGKKNEFKSYDITIVFDVQSEKPITESVMGKLKKKIEADKIIDRVDQISPYRIKLTCLDSYTTMLKDPSGVDVSWTEEEVLKILHSCSKAFEIKKTSVFIYG